MNAKQIKELNINSYADLLEVCDEHSSAADQDWAAETTSFYFEDGSRVDVRGICREARFYRPGNENMIVEEFHSQKF